MTISKSDHALIEGIAASYVLADKKLCQRSSVDDLATLAKCAYNALNACHQDHCVLDLEALANASPEKMVAEVLAIELNSGPNWSFPESFRPSFALTPTA